RPITLTDIEQGARLLGALADTPVHGIAPGIPQDVLPPLQGLAQLIASAKNKSGPAAYAPHYPQAQPFIRECYEVLGQPHGAGIHMVSPLRFEGQEVDEALAYRAEHPEGSIGIGTMPIIGASTPASVLSAFTIALAEIVGCALILIATGTPAAQIGLSINAYPFDMRHGAFVYGTPSNLVCTMVERELNRYLGTEIPAKSFSVMAQHPGPQANALKGLFTGFMLAQGRTSFSGAGGLSLDELYSPIQLIYDREIILFLKSSQEMLTASLDEDLLMVEEIVGATSDSFMDTDSTLKNFRTLQWDSNIFPTRMLRQWQDAGCPMEQAAAKSEINRLLANYDYHLPTAQSEALDEIYTQATRTLLA
ncbi:MAG: trimethylamine methyltransferase family protein, partial [Armatimonadia bacterium]